MSPVVQLRRPPPVSDLHAEGGVIARALEGDNSVFDHVNGAHFYSAGNARVFTAAMASFETSGLVSARVIAEILRLEGVHYVREIEPDRYLLELLADHEWGSTTDRYVARVLRAWRARELERVLTEGAARVRLGEDPGAVFCDIQIEARRMGVIEGRAA